MNLADLTAAVREFAEERDWEQFHSAKNLAISVMVEAAELLELVQWKSDDTIAADLEHEAARRAMSDEIADVLIYLVRLADVIGVGLDEAVQTKMRANANRYPADEVKGSAEKR